MLARKPYLADYDRLMPVKITGAHDTFGDSTSDGQETSVAASVGYLCNISLLGPAAITRSLVGIKCLLIDTVLAPKKSAVGLGMCPGYYLAEVMFPPALVKVVWYVP